MPEAPKRTRRFTEDEIAEDSEPERAEVRRKQRKAKTTPRRVVCNDPNTSEATQKPVLNPFTTEVIEISDSDSESFTLNKNIGTRIRVERNAISRAVSPSTVPGPNQIPTIDAFSSCFQRERESPPKISKNLLSDEESDTASKAIRVLDPKRFAYASTTTLKKKNLPTVPLPARTRERESVLPLAIIKPTTFDLSNDNLSKVSRCVCCQVAWTVKKSGPQKLTHIRSCAKKLALKEETVRILLQTEIANCVLPLNSKGKSKAKEPLPEAGPSTRKTFLEEIVGDEPRKKAKRKQVETTLADVSTTRDSILARAQNILSTSTLNVPDVDGNAIAVDQPFRPPSLLDVLDNESSPPTQPFSRSSLGHLHGASVSLFNSNTPPLRVNSTNADTSHRYIHITASEPSGVSPPPLEPIMPSRSLKDIWEIGQTASPDKTIRSRRRMSLDLNSKVNSRKDHVADMVDSLEKVSLSSPSPFPCSSLDKAFSALNVQTTPKKTPQRAKRTTKSRSPKSSAKKRKKAVDYGVKWEAHMMKHIIQDAALYQRILHYEPIHFNIFLEIAALYAPINSKMKEKTHLFLDQQAILTYGRALWGKRDL